MSDEQAAAQLYAAFDGRLSSRRVIEEGGFHPEIILAISEVMKEVHYVQKDGWNQFHKFAFVTMGSLLASLQPAMAKAGLVIFQNEVRRAVSGDLMAIDYEFILTHVSGKVWKFASTQVGLAICRNSKGGWDDKAANKCHTAARKYYILGLFQTATGDEADADGESAAAPETRVAPKAIGRPNSEPEDRSQPADDGQRRVAAPSGKAVGQVSSETDRLRDVYSRLKTHATSVKNTAHARELLKLWNEHAEQLSAIRDRGDAWPLLIKPVVAALEQAFGGFFVEIWASAANAESEARVAELNNMWFGGWRAGLAELASSDPDTFALLKEHMAIQHGRFSPPTPDAERLAA